MAKEVKKEEKTYVVDVNLGKTVEINGQKYDKISMDFEGLTGNVLMQIDAELRMEGSRFVDVHDFKTLLKLASRASGINEADLSALPMADIIEITANVRSFILNW